MNGSLRSLRIIGVLKIIPNPFCKNLLALMIISSMSPFLNVWHCGSALWSRRWCGQTTIAMILTSIPCWIAHGAPYHILIILIWGLKQQPIRQLIGWSIYYKLYVYIYILYIYIICMCIHIRFHHYSWPVFVMFPPCYQSPNPVGWCQPRLKSPGWSIEGAHQAMITCR